MPSEPSVTVVCMKWGTFPTEYVHVLRSAVRPHLPQDHRFVCIWDTDEGLEPSIDVIPMPEMPVSRERRPV